jgi:hypothetical protein
LCFAACFWIIESVNYARKTHSFEEHFSKGRVKLQNVMQGAADAASKTLIFGRVEAGGEYLKCVELCELKTDLFGLGCNILDRFAAVNLDYFVLVWTFEQL